MNNIILNFDKMDEEDTSIYYIDLYKSTLPISINNLPVPLLKDYTDNMYIDSDILKNKTYYYVVRYKNEFGTYIATINKKINTSNDDLYIDNLKYNPFINEDTIDNLAFSKKYKTINGYDIILAGYTRALYNRNNNSTGIYFASGTNTTTNNTENGGLKINVSDAFNNNKFSIEMYTACSPIDNTTNTTLLRIADSGGNISINTKTENNNIIPGLSVNIPTRVRYIRDWLNGSNVNGGNHWVEIQAFDQYGVNVAYGKSGISSIDTWNSLITNNVTASSPYYEAGLLEQWVKVDLGGEYKIETIKVWHYYADSRIYNATKTEVSLDGLNWFTVFDSRIHGKYTESSAGKTHNLIYESTSNINNNIPLLYNQYNHVCVMRDSNYINLYINGELSNQVIIDPDFAITNKSIYIGTTSTKISSCNAYFESIKIANSLSYNINGFTPNIDLINDTNTIAILKFNKNGIVSNVNNTNTTVSQYGLATNNLYYNNYNYVNPIYMRAASDRMYGYMEYLHDNFTVEFTINIDNSTAANATIFQIGQYSLDMNVYISGTGATRNIVGTIEGIYFSTNTYILPNIDYNICIMRNSIYFYVYINGVLETKVENINVNAAEAFISIGGNGTAGIIGVIDNFKIYNTNVYQLEGYDINERIVSTRISPKQYLLAQNNALIFNNTDVVNITRTEYNTDNAILIANQIDNNSYDISDDIINGIYKYDVYYNKDNYGPYNKDSIILDKHKYDVDLDNLRSVVSPKIYNNNNLSYIYDEKGNFPHTSEKAIIIDYTKFKNFCKITGTNTTANNTVNGGFSVPIDNIGIQDFCIEIRCILTETAAEQSRIFTIGTIQTNANSKETGIWFRYSAGTYGLVFYNGITPITITIPNGTIIQNKIHDITVSRMNGIFYIHVDGIVVAYLDNMTDISILGSNLYFFTDIARINNIQGYYTNIKATIGNSRYSGINYTVPNKMLIETDYLYDNVELAIDFANSSIYSNVIYDMSKNKRIIIPVGSVTNISLPTDDNYIYANGSSSLFGLYDTYIGNSDFTIEFDFVLQSGLQNTWRTIFTIGKFGAAGHLKIALNTINMLLVQLYYNGAWYNIGTSELSEEELSKPITICITRNKTDFYSYKNKKIIGIYKTASILNMMTGLRFAKYVNTYPNGGGELIHALYKNIRISNIWRYFGQNTYEYNYKDQPYKIGNINNFNVTYNGIKNIITLQSEGSFTNYIIYRIDRISHHNAGTIVSQGAWNTNIIIDDINIENNTSYCYIAKLYGGTDLIFSEWVNIYTNENGYHFKTVNIVYDRMDTTITWESDNTDDSTYRIYITDKKNPTELNKNIYFTVNNTNTYTISRPTQNKKYYVYIERIINNEVVAFYNKSYHTNVYGLLYNNYICFTTNFYYGIQHGRSTGIFYNTWNEYHSYIEPQNQIDFINVRPTGNFTVTTPQTLTYRMNLFGVSLYFRLYNWVSNGCYNNCKMYFEDDAGNIYAYLQYGVDSSGTGAMVQYGTTTSSLTTAAKTDSYPAIEGRFELTTTSLKYINIRTSQYINSFTISNTNMYKVTRLRITDISARNAYTNTGDGSWSSYSDLRILP